MTVKVLSVDADMKVSSITKVTVWVPKSVSESGTIDIVAYYVVPSLFIEIQL